MERKNSRVTKSCVSDLIKDRRARFGITQKKLAELLGYENPQVGYLIESGRMRLPLNRLRRASRALFIDKADLAAAVVFDYAKEVEKHLATRSK